MAQALADDPAQLAAALAGSEMCYFWGINGGDPAATAARYGDLGAPEIVVKNGEGAL